MHVFQFRQASAGQHGTAYKFQAAVPEDMWTSMMVSFILSILGNVLSTSMLGYVLVVAKVVVISHAF